MDKKIVHMKQKFPMPVDGIGNFLFIKIIVSG